MKGERIKRRAKRKLFIRRNRHLFQLLEGASGDQKDRLRELIAKRARKEIGYSRYTLDIDLLNVLVRQFNRLKALEPSAWWEAGDE